jgi:hypothetical protein
MDLLAFFAIVVGVPSLIVLVFGIGHGALTSLAPLFLLLATDALVLAICTLNVGG